MEITITQMFDSCLPGINKTVQSFYKKYGGDYNNYLSEAYFTFVKKYNQGVTDPSVMGASVYFALCEYRRTQIRIGQRHTTLDDKVLPQKHSFDLESFLKEMSPDAVTLVKLVLESPQGPGHRHTKILSRLGSKKKPSKITQTLQGMGWTLSRILESVREIKEALS